MGNCLVTKLKSSVDNPLLPRLDEIIIKFSSTYTGNLVVNNSSIDVCRMDGTVVETKAAGTYMKYNPGFDGFFRIKKTITALGVAYTDFDLKAINFAECDITGMFSVGFTKFADSIENIVKYMPNATNYNFDGLKTITGNLECLLTDQDTLVPSRLNVLVVKSPNVTAKRSTINKLTNLLATFSYSGITIIEDVE